MKIATATLRSVSPYSQSRYHKEEKRDDESHADHRERTWKKHCHVNDDGNIIIPPMAFKNCLYLAAKFRSIKKIGKQTYTKHFKAGVGVLEPAVLNVTIDDVEPEWLFLNADGKSGGGTRVEKCYPLIKSWETTVVFHIFDDEIPRDVFALVLSEAGKFIGVGRFRPENGGFYGRFEVVKIEWEGE